MLAVVGATTSALAPAPNSDDASVVGDAVITMLLPLQFWPQISTKDFSI